MCCPPPLLDVLTLCASVGWIPRDLVWRAATISFFGACVGIAIPLSTCLASSINASDILIWGSIAVILQLLCFQAVDIFLKDMSKRINDGEISISIVLVSVKISIALLNAAAIS